MAGKAITLARILKNTYMTGFIPESVSADDTTWAATADGTSPILLLWRLLPRKRVTDVG